MWRGIKLSKGKFRFYIKEKNPNGNMLKNSFLRNVLEASMLEGILTVTETTPETDH